MASEYEGYRCRFNAAAKAAGSGERTSVGVRSGSVRLGTCHGNQNCPL